MNIASNPWSFTSADQNTASITGLVLNDDGTVTLSCGSFDQNELNVGDKLTIYNPDVLAYQGFYKVYDKPSSGVYVIIPINFVIPAGTSSGTSGTAAQNQYADEIRAEDISWQSPGNGEVLILLDKNGNVIWKSTASGAGVFSRGKIMWVNGLTLLELGDGIILVTVN